MAQTINISTKRLAIDKAQAQIVIIVGVASFVTIFCLIASRAVWSQNQYQARVITAKSAANEQLQKNITAFNDLKTSYTDFNDKDPNAIGGSKSGTGDNDGTNTRIVLDALPNKYDFPALASSLEKVFTDRHYTVGSLSGSDDQLAQQSNISSPNPTPVPIPFGFTVTNTNYDGIKSVINTLQTSIRPMPIDGLTISGGGNSMLVSIRSHTYYQPGKSLSITTKVVK